MKTIDELRLQWSSENTSATTNFSEDSFQKIVKSRVRKQSQQAFKYFWASFVLQIAVYALLGHVIIKSLVQMFGARTTTYDAGAVALLGFCGVALYVPFTFVLMKKFKAMATSSRTKNADAPIREYAMKNYQLLSSFFKFKKVYELVLIPLSSALGTIVCFELWFPGGVLQFPTGAAMVFAITLLSCVWVIRDENKVYFERPIAELRVLLDELEG